MVFISIHIIYVVDSDHTACEALFGSIPPTVNIHTQCEAVDLQKLKFD